MTFKRVSLMILSAAVFAGGCAGGPLTTREKSTLGGAALGAGTGALIGEVSGGKPGTGAAIGAGVGALGGALVGDQIQGSERRPYYDDY